MLRDLFEKFSAKITGQMRHSIAQMRHQWPILEQGLKFLRDRTAVGQEIFTKNVKILSWLALGLFGLLTFVGTIESLNLKTQYKLRQFFPRYHPLLRQDEIVTSRFH